MSKILEILHQHWTILLLLVFINTISIWEVLTEGDSPFILITRTCLVLGGYGLVSAISAWWEDTTRE